MQEQSKLLCKNFKNSHKFNQKILKFLCDKAFDLEDQEKKGHNQISTTNNHK